LPEHLSARSELRDRFEREARTISGLNHPHICTLYDIADQDGIRFLVMEYLEGETLADRLSKGALPLPDALKYAIEIVEALDKAHRSGVVHRDLKPGNIMITKSGTKLRPSLPSPCTTIIPALSDFMRPSAAPLLCSFPTANTCVLTLILPMLNYRPMTDAWRPSAGS
jgi:serine/threonine protein kinase